MQTEAIIITPIGYEASGQVYRYITRRERALASGNISVIELLTNKNF